MYEYTRSVFYIFFQNGGGKKLFSLQNAMKKVFEARFLEKNCLQIPKIVTPPIKR